ncbi:MAG: citrate lyase subunit alpha [Synergistales bacterium]|nr:citrate lyase subunit alpha [Synergistales bacterium]
MKMTTNSIGRKVPVSVPGWGKFSPYNGPASRLDGQYQATTAQICSRVNPASRDKVVPSLREAIENTGLSDGMTISFHHHLRNGDAVLKLVMDTIEEMGIMDLTLAPSSLTDAHDCVADYIRRGTVRRVSTSGVRGEVGKAISSGELEIPAIIRSHGGRARAIEEGSIAIDVAFLAAPTCDQMGNLNGLTGKSACGSLGYAIHDARHARYVIAVTDNLVQYPLHPFISIPQVYVDHVVRVNSLGDPSKIATGAARLTKDPLQLRIAQNAFDLIKASELLAPGCSFQVGVGAISIAVASDVREYMREKGIRGGFCVGGIGGFMTSMLEEGLFEALFDTQGFDASVTDSLLKNPSHIEMDVSWYANPFNKGCIVNNLDVVVLSALDVDLDFNVNVLTGHDGILRGASGGHSDTAFGSSLCIIVLPSYREGVPSIVDRVQTVVTPGETVDAIVTERGIAINPRREDLLLLGRKAGLPLRDIEGLKRETEKVTGIPDPVEFDHDHPVALVEYRDGTLIDTVYRIR